MIIFKDVEKTYPEGNKALEGINLTINDGEFVCVIGLSGAGKSTLVKTINKMLPITSGQLLVDGHDISRLKGKSLRMARRNIGMIFQSFNLVKRSSVYKNVLAGRVGYHNWFTTLFSIYSKYEKKLALENLRILGILDKAFVRADRLSGGQQQRVALARALTQNAKIVLADEPTASLDPVTTTEVMDDFRLINRKFGITVVANMHHVDVSRKYASRIIGIRDGHVVFDGKPAAVTDTVLKEIYGRGISKEEVLEDNGNVR